MFKVKFADIGEGLTEGTVTEVFVKVGDDVKIGDNLFNVETDKVNSDIASEVAGKIAKINIKADQEINVGDIVMEIDDGKDGASAPEEPEEENASVVGATPVSNDVIPSRAPEQASAPAAAAPSQKVAATQAVIKDPSKHYEVIVIGAGVGGYVASIKASQLGLKTLNVEKQYYGGVCLNVGCIPTKTLLKSANIYDEVVNESAKFGVQIGDAKNIKADWKAIQARKDDVVSKLTNGVQGLLKKYKVDKVFGNAEAIDAHTIKVDGTEYTTDNLIIATGSVPNGLPLPGFAEAEKSGFLINSTSGLSLPKIPKSLVIIGGGVIGVEFAALYARLGTEITILQAMPTILEMLDSDISKELTKILTKKRPNLKIITNVKTKSIEGKTVVFEVDGKEQKITADYCLQSVGRKGVTTGFDNIGIEKNERGYIVIDEYCETNVPNVYAIGDVTGKLMLAHVASHEGIIAANRIASLKGLEHAHDMKMNWDRVPSCIYTHPEVASVGKTEDELKKANVQYKTYKFPFAAIGKALADGSTDGFVKLIIEPEFGKLIGAHIISNTATDMISEITTVMEAEGTIDELAMAIHPHPTLSEAIGEAAEALVSGKPINF